MRLGHQVGRPLLHMYSAARFPTRTTFSVQAVSTLLMGCQQTGHTSPPSWMPKIAMSALARVLRSALPRPQRLFVILVDHTRQPRGQGTKPAVFVSFTSSSRACRALPSEMVWSLSGSKNITGTLQTFCIQVGAVAHHASITGEDVYLWWPT